MTATDIAIHHRSIPEEVFNSITHGLGALAGIVGLVIGLLSFVAPTSYMVGFLVYIASLILLMTISSLYHALAFTRAKRVFQVLDHSSIFVLIAGSFTPFIMRLYSGWALVVALMIIWVLAATGITLSASLPKLRKRFGVLLYIGFGWLGLLLVPKLIHLHTPVMWLVLLGGVLYTVGAMLLISKRPFMHVGWHVFVVGAAIAHFFAVVKLA